jgi:hypothetical protein
MLPHAVDDLRDTPPKLEIECHKLVTISRRRVVIVVSPNPLPRGLPMPRRIVSAITRALKHEWTQTDVHFHAGPGRAYPCHDRACTSRHLDVG